MGSTKKSLEMLEVESERENYVILFQLKTFKILMANLTKTERKPI